jgi:hypothetical protein
MATHVLQESDWIEGEFVHQLAARKRIQELEESEVQADQCKEAIVKLGLKYGLASTHTRNQQFHKLHNWLTNQLCFDVNEDLLLNEITLKSAVMQ